MKYIGNAFSLQMIEGDCEILVANIPQPSPEELGEMVSCVGHADTAQVIGVKFNRMNVRLEKGDELVVAQVVGGRLPEGATTLPEGFRLAWKKVVVK